MAATSDQSLPSLDYRLRLRHPCVISLTGPSGCGKSTIIERILNNLGSIFNPTRFDVIYYCYGVKTERMPRHPLVRLHHGPPDMTMLEAPGNKLLILEDLQSFFVKNKKQLSDLATRYSHHCSTSVINVTQNAFAQERTARTNSQYLIMCKCKCDKLQAMTIARQIFPSRPDYLMEAIRDNEEKPYSYILLDLHPETKSDRMVIANAFTDEPLVYVPRRDL